MRKRTLKQKFYTGCGYSIFGALAFAFFLGLSVAYGIKTASIIVGAIVTVFWLILIAICLIEEGEPHEKKRADIDVIDFNNWNYDLKANSNESR
jgi:hypothetical protein